MPERAVTIHSLVGGSLEIVLPPPGDRPGFFAFSLHKAGSTLLFELLRDAMSAAAFPVVDIPGAAFARGLAEAYLDDSINHAFKTHGYGYLGWRFFPFTSRFPHDQVRNILLVRDPRDILVSLFFSISRSHVLPEKGPLADVVRALREKTEGRTIDEWMFDDTAVRESLFGSWARMVRSQFERYQDFLPARTTRTYRYEDVVFRKRDWLCDMLEYLDFELPPDLISAIAKKHDVLPEEERPDQHVRQVTPGNHRKHLASATIEKLNNLFAEVLDRFDYHDEGGFGRQLCVARGGRRTVGPGKAAADAATGLHDQDDEFQFVRGVIPLLTPTFVDVGAEKGTFASLCLAQGMSGVAFEPLPDHLPALQALAVGHDLAIYPWAIDAEDREATLHIAVDEHGDVMDHFHSLQRIDGDPRVNHRRQMRVQCRSLQSLEEEGVIPARIGVLKTDTEGNDLRVLQGLGRLRPDIIVCEFFTEGIYSGWKEAHPTRLIECLKGLGYEHVLVFTRSGSRRETRADPDVFEGREWGNLVCLHRRVYDAVDSLRRSLMHLPAAPAAGGTGEDVARLREICEERLQLIQRIHREAAELRGELERIQGEREGS